MLALYSPPAVKYKDLLSDIFFRIKKQYQLDVCYFFLFDDTHSYAHLVQTLPDKKEFRHSASVIDLRPGNSLLNLVIREKKLVLCDDGPLNHNDTLYQPLNQQMVKECYLPITSLYGKGERVIGCIYLGSFDSRPQFNFDTLDFSLLQDSFCAVYYAFNILYKKSRERNKFYSLINIFSEIYKNQYDQINHLYNVAYWSLLIAKELKLDEASRYQLYIASVLHDIGTLYLPQELINSHHRYSEAEARAIEKHVIYGAQILPQLDFETEDLHEIGRLIRHHHERYDGAGYPDQLAGSSIPLLSRIICVADALDAMLSERKYRPSKTLGQAIHEFRINRGKQFDPAVTDALIRVMKHQKDSIETILGPMTWGSLLVTADSGFYHFQGDIIRYNHGFKFVTNEYTFDNTGPLKNDAILHCSLVVFKGGRIHELDVKNHRIIDHQMFIGDLILKPADHYFSIFWELEGFVSEAGKKKTAICLHQLGGNSMTFYVNAKKGNPVTLKKNQLYHVELLFEDEEKLLIPGQVTRSYMSSHYVFYDYEYKNITEHLRDKIFKQIFNRQSEMIRMD